MKTCSGLVKKCGQHSKACGAWERLLLLASDLVSLPCPWVLGRWGKEQVEAGGCSPMGLKGCEKQGGGFNGDPLERTSDGQLLLSAHSACLLASFGVG